MNRSGFTLVELLATLVVLGIVVGITVISVNGGFGTAKSKSEDIFVDTIKDAMKVYLDSDAKELDYSLTGCIINKTHGNVNLYKATNDLTILNVINSTYKPISKNDFVNPANEDADCNVGATIAIYRDDDYVYYYKVNVSEIGCLNNTDKITNLPDSVGDCLWEW